MGNDEAHPVHARDAEGWSEKQWRRWSIEQAVACGDRRTGTIDLAKEIFESIFPPCTVQQDR